jgi:protein-tyrosine-phosphatase
MKILFVCTGNVFRSMSAEYCAKKYAEEHGIEIDISSAGTIAPPEKPFPKTINQLLSLGIDPRKHKQTKVTQEVLDTADVVIAMSTDHKRFLKEHFGRDSYLFNELAYHESKGMNDVHVEVHDWQKNIKAREKHIANTVNHIHEGIPELMNSLKKINN